MTMSGEVDGKASTTPEWRAGGTIQTAKSLLRIGRRSVAVLGAAALTAVTPVAFDRAVSSAVYRGFVRLRPDRVRLIADRIEDVIGDASRSEPSDASIRAALGYWRMRIEVRYAEARGSGPRGWMPSVSVEGLEHVEHALARGNGAVLWRMTFTSATVVNAALYANGIRAIHLSSDRHGQSDDAWWTKNVEAPFTTRSETRWLDRRVIQPSGGGLGYLVELREALRDNRVVTITGDRLRGRHTEVQPVGNHHYRLATGAPSLAHASGSSLHTCVAFREGPFRYRLIIGPDLGTSALASKPAARRAAVEEYARQLDHRLRTSPESSMWWGRH